VSATVAVLGPGGVGGALTVRLALAGHRVICVATPPTGSAIRHEGITLELAGEELHARPDVAEHLDEPVDLLLVTVKATGLEDGLGRIERAAVADGVVLPLLNGLEHVAVVRGQLGCRVAAGSIARMEAFRATSTRVVQPAPTPLVAAASVDLDAGDLERALEPLRDAGVELRLRESEAEVLWEKAVRLAVLAPATALTQRSVGELRSDPDWRQAMEAAIAEACEIATADGVPMRPEAQWEIIDSVPYTLSTSAARDVAAGKPSEIDAITGGVVRAGMRLDVRCPALVELYERCRAL
jgi:2-dehydropantoate 2-reductase